MQANSSSTNRRGLLAGLGALIAGGLAGLTPVLAGAFTFLDPLRKSAHDGRMVFVTRLGAVPDDGVPRKFDIITDKRDAWNTYPNVPVGAVYLRRDGEGRLAALHVVCPHAGCFVGLASDKSHFACPCHGSHFALDGRINDPASPSPRDMDELAVEIRNGDEIWVRFVNFRPGVKEKVAVV